MDWARTTARRNEKHLSLGFGVPYITGLMVFVFWLTLLMNLGGGHILQLTSNILLWVLSGPPGILLGNIGLVEIAQVSSQGTLLQGTLRYYFSWYSQWTAHSSLVSVSYGVSLVSTESDYSSLWLCFAVHSRYLRSLMGIIISLVSNIGINKVPLI